jgi:hypothetical protein
MEINDLSIADLKAAYDFVLIDLKELEIKAKEKGINPEQIDAYNEVKETESTLYHKLLNITRMLK